MKKNQSGHSNRVLKDYHNRQKKDYKSLPLSDQKIIYEINRLLKELSEEGKDYWQNYYS